MTLPTKSWSDALSSAVGEPMVTIERMALGYCRLPREYRLSRGAADGFR